MSKEFKLPETVKILYHEYKVKQVRNLDKLTECQDAADYDSGEIWIDADLAGTRLKEVFWHSVIERLMGDIEIKTDNHPVFCAFIQGLLPIMDAVEAYQEGE